MTQTKIIKNTDPTTTKRGRIEKLVSIQLALIILIGGFVRYLYFQALPPIGFPDSVSYLTLVESIFQAKGINILLSAGNLYRPPLYTLFLSLVALVSDNKPDVIVISQHVLSMIVAICVYWLCFWIYQSHWISFLSGLLVSLHPYLLLFGQIILSETLFIFLLALFCVFLVRSVQTERCLYFVLAGVFLGLATLTRPVTQGFWILIPFLFFLLWRQWRKTIKYALLLIATFWIVILPWLVRNYAVEQKFVFTAFLGRNIFARVADFDNLLDVNSPTTFPIVKETYKKQQAIWFPQPAIWPTYRELVKNYNYSEAEVDQMMLVVALETIRNHPVEYALNTLRYTRDILSANIWYEWVLYDDPNQFSQGLSFMPFASNFPPPQPASLALIMIKKMESFKFPDFGRLSYLFFVLLGMIISIRRAKSRVGLVLITLIVYIIIISVSVEPAVGRYRLPVDPYLILFFSGGIWHLGVCCLKLIWEP